VNNKDDCLKLHRVVYLINTPKSLNNNINNQTISDKQTADAVNNYVLKDDMLHELQYFRHKQFTNITTTCTFNTCDKDIHSRGLEIENYKPKHVVSYNATRLKDCDQYMHSQV
jgi:hypothetical protein